MPSFIRATLLPVIHRLLLLTMLWLPLAALSAEPNAGSGSSSFPTLTTQHEQSPPDGRQAEGRQADGLELGDSAACMRCHRMSTLAYRDRASGKIVDLSIHPQSYTDSSHRALACGDCHQRSYQRYPHRQSSAEEALSCVGCHREQAQAHRAVPEMDAIDAEYRRSVHVTSQLEDFSCFSCHNAHSFRPEPKDAPPAQRVAANNGVCLHCHIEQRGALPVGHDWLPRPSEHWQAVRCVDCHAPVNGSARVSHRILSGADSARHCVDCHTRDSRLLNQLYSWRSEQALFEQGFLRQALYNDAYIVGMSRNDQLDRFSLAVLALVLLGILAHGTGRWISYRKRSKS
jgi:hypothetical protein